MRQKMHDEVVEIAKKVFNERFASVGASYDDMVDSILSKYEWKL